MRQCGLDGKWAQKPDSEQIFPNGWTNFSNCYWPGVLKMMKGLGTQAEKEVRK